MTAGVVATVLAAGRAVATARGLLHDPFAAPLVHAAGMEFCTRVADGELDLDRLGSDGGFPRLAELSAARTRFFDDFCADATRTGIGQVVLLGAGLDARAYRLWWPESTVVFEVDEPAAVQSKTAALRGIGARPSVHRRAVGTDLSGDWATALRRVGFDAAAPTAWVIEGLLVGALPPNAQDRLLDGVSRLSARGSRLAADHATPPSRSQEAHRESLLQRWHRRGLDVARTGRVFAGEYLDVGCQLQEQGWLSRSAGTAELFAASRLPPLSPRDLDGAPTAIGYLTAIRR